MPLRTLSHLRLVLLFACLRAASCNLHYNVLKDANFPDPSIVNVQGISHVFATTDGDTNIPMTHNGDFNDASGWAAITDAFPVDDVPAFGSKGWAEPLTSWAPDVNHLTDFDGSYAMYYSPALQSNNGIHCMGLARSSTISGPYNDSSTEPFICPESDGGAIDASGYLDDNNKRYVVYKIDAPAIQDGSYCASPDNAPSYNTSLMLQQVEHDASTPVRGPAVLYNNDGVKDKYNIEAPIIVKGKDGTYFLFFNSGCFGDNSYTINYVTSTNGIWGPYDERKVLLETGDYGLYGPGGPDIAQETGDMVFHSLLTNNSVDDGRVLNTATVTLKGRLASIDK